jgi:transcriptional regulator with XRE-family HTH domain
MQSGNIMGMSLKHFQDNLAEIMRDRGLTFRGLAESAGMAYPFINRIATGKANPSIAAADKIADALGVPLAELLADPSAKISRITS